MKFSYKFSNLFGTMYRKGNVLFTTDGNSIISPVGNRLTIHDLRNNKARTLSLGSRYNYKTIALSPNGKLLIAVNEIGDAQLISMISCTVIHRHKFQTGVKCVVFSPDGAYFAVAETNLVLIYRISSTLTGEYNPFILERYFIGGYDDITCIEWSTDSRFLAIGCRDNSTKICALRYMANFRTYILGGHTDTIVACFFEANSLHLNTLSRNGQFCIWQCSLALSDISEFEESECGLKENRAKKCNTYDFVDVSDDDVCNNKEKSGLTSEPIPTIIDEYKFKRESIKNAHPFFYKHLSRHYLGDEPRKEHRDAVLTAAHYNCLNKIMVVAFSTGIFYLYKIPEVDMIHSLCISDYSISTALFNSSGDWVALASQELGQLLVWEWQSEQYIMKQQGHSSEMTCIAYSPEDHFIATGGRDAKVKLWNLHSGFCIVTFSEHTSGVTGVQFSRNKKFLVSSSMDGTVRAFDIIR